MEPNYAYGTISNLETIIDILDREPGIRVVSFDFGNTLVHWTNTPHERHIITNNAATKILQEHALPITPDEYQIVRNGIWYKIKKKCKEQGTDFKARDAVTEIVTQAFASKGKRTSREDAYFLAGEIEKEICSIENATLVLNAEAHKTLEELHRRRIPAVIYSNNPLSSAYVAATLQHLGVEHYFEVIMASSDLGFQKSSHNLRGFQAFAYLLKQKYSFLQASGVSARESTLHVGDNYNEDYEGALAAKLRAVHYTPNDASPGRQKGIAQQEKFARLKQNLSDNAILSLLYPIHKEMINDSTFLLHDVLPASACNALISLSERLGYNPAPTYAPDGSSSFSSYRTNMRAQIFNEHLANELWQRTSSFLPSSIEGATLQRLRRTFKFYRYEPGQKYGLHQDGTHSGLTFLLYLNDTILGGETNFLGGHTIIPKRGTVLCFPHKLFHEALPVDTGIKYVLRTDVVYG